MTATSLISIEVPDIGDFSDVPIIEVFVAAGDTVAVDDPIVTLESDKATMDVPATAAGVVKDLHVKVGDKVSEGTLLVTVEGSANSAGPVASKAPAVPSAGEPSEAATADSIDSATQAEDQAGPEARAPAVDGHKPVYASPAVRRLARERGVDLSAVQGSGRKGRITRDDVEGHVAHPPSATPAPSAPAGTGVGLDLLPWPTVDFEKLGPVERVERSRIQRISARNLARNWVMIPHVTHNDEADITGLEAWRKQLNDEHARDGVKVTMVSFLIVASVATLKAFPIVNASLDGDELVLKRYYNIGFAADTPGGLVVPVIKNADQKGLLEIARELTELSSKARDGKLMPADMSGATFTISSLGGIGGTSFSPIINA
ncbi:MAG: 2-oxo acid dehydrogenase subunit E2, partial [Solirubrobacteraceae bacterium]